MSFIEKINSAVPEFSLKQSALEAVLNNWSGAPDNIKNKIVSLGNRVGVSKRSFIVPPSQVLELEGLAERAKIFEDQGFELLKQAVKPILEDASVDKNNIDHVIFTSCSVPIIPALDSKIVEYFELSPHITRIPVFQYGCAGGVFSLGLANKLAKLGKSVLVLSLELCSLVFQGKDHSIAQLIGTSLFADGACALLITPEVSKSQMQIVDWQSYLVPDSRKIMGYDLKDSGLHLRLDQSLPDTLTKSFPELVEKLLTKHNLQVSDIGNWLFHPGSVKIVEMLRASLDLKPEQVRWAADILENNGNMSSATILFVVEHFMKSAEGKSGQNVIVAGVGPGLTVELLLLRNN